MTTWRDTYVPARLEERLDGDRVRCHLSPRNCELKDGQHGFCGVRANRGGRLVTMNYGKSVHATEETIETEAVNHFAPGERILSMGNIGCMLNCSYCHNWKTSQAKHVSDDDVYHYTPEGVIDIAQRHGIRVISWTYNDPVVWHEFVRDTARLAQQAGLINLYKSAFYITPEAVEELLPFIDIFSISLKSLDEEYYRKITKGRLQPVLDATRLVHRAGKHVEVSTLMITDLSDDEATAKKVTEWVLTELDDRVPMHFVRFHPDYRMRDSVRTPIPRLIRAREVARSIGARHVYLGNVYDTPFTDTVCNSCETLLVTRYGLNASNVGLDQAGHCRSCGSDANFKMMATPPPPRTTVPAIPAGLTVKQFDWHGDVRSLHVTVRATGSTGTRIFVRRLAGTASPWPYLEVKLQPGESYRFIVARGHAEETGCEVAMPDDVHSNLHEVFDRAHFPTVSVEQAGVTRTDIHPLPLYPGT